VVYSFDVGSGANTHLKNLAYEHVNKT